MPKFNIAFQVSVHHQNGLVEIEAPSLEEALRIVREEKDVDELVDLTSSEETEVDAWDAESEDQPYRREEDET